MKTICYKKERVHIVHMLCLSLISASTFNIINGISNYNQKRFNIIHIIYDYKHTENNNWECLINEVDQELEKYEILPNYNMMLLILKILITFEI